ncbi:hypothetical protein Nepgr_033890 [Nepenthes gracilis]|uniref:Uncharacterized protein n=1 Tax=Nepenthes gracilis TaxID=150966 RepID=A0AAD3TMQ7_NEPGR|nr:hypothetical protein Nepgr_033890 [Nepenthes gracilis]
MAGSLLLELQGGVLTRALMARALPSIGVLYALMLPNSNRPDFYFSFPILAVAYDRLSGSFHGGVDGWWLDFLLLRLCLAESLPMEVLRDYEANCIDFVMPWAASFCVDAVMLSPPKGGSDCLAMELC